MKTWKHTTACGILALGTPLLATAQGAEAPVSRDALFDLEPIKEKTVAPTPAAAPEMPSSKDALFDLEPVKEKTAAPAPVGTPEIPISKDALFDLPPPSEGTTVTTTPVKAESKEALFGDIPGATVKEEKKSAAWNGFFQGELARTFADPDHWSKATGRLELGKRGRLDNGMQYKISGRVDYNAVYDINDFYASAVRKDQRAEFHLRENYLDFSSGDWEYRLGRQHIVWGEMIGLFFADVVSAKDMREFILQDFQLMRIPQWAARAEYFKDDYHAELIWIPFPSYDEVGKPFDPATGRYGSDFYAYPATPLGIAPMVLGETKPASRLSNTNYGLRLSRLTHGWDMSGFLYSSMSSSPTAYAVDKTTIPGVYQYQLRHDRIHQVGGTLAKDMGGFVLKAEAIYTGGRRYNVTDAADPDGVVKQNTLDWVLGLDFNPGIDTRLNTQFFQRIYFDHNPNIIPDRVENGFSLLVNHKFSDALEAEALVVRSLNRSDWMFRPKLNWGFQPNWKLTFGLDVFVGPPTGIFGQIDNMDRIYTELRYDF